MKITQSGRSMVEMLGVLAIIGMLSVGGIWGFSEAIERYKLNRARAQISTILNAVYTHAYDNRAVTDKRLSLIPYYKYKTPALFDDMPIVKSNEDPHEFLQDAMGAYISIYIHTSVVSNRLTIVNIGGSSRSAPYINTMKIDTGVAYCRNVWLILQSLYKDNPQKFCYINLRYPENRIMPVWNGANYGGYDVANMSFGQVTNMCYDALTAGKGQFLFTICFNNTKE